MQISIDNIYEADDLEKKQDPLAHYSIEEVIRITGAANTIVWSVENEVFEAFHYNAELQGVYINKSLSPKKIILTIFVDADEIVSDIYFEETLAKQRIPYNKLKQLLRRIGNQIGYDESKLILIALKYTVADPCLKELRIKAFMQHLFKQKKRWELFDPVTIKAVYGKECDRAYHYSTDLNFDLFYIVRLEDDEFPLISQKRFFIIGNVDIFIFGQVIENYNAVFEIRDLKKELLTSLGKKKIYEIQGIPITDTLCLMVKEENEANDNPEMLFYEEENPYEDEPDIMQIDDGSIKISNNYIEKIWKEYSINESMSPERTLVSFRLSTGLTQMKHQKIILSFEAKYYAYPSIEELKKDDVLKYKNGILYNCNGLELGDVRFPFDMEALVKKNKIRIEKVSVFEVIKKDSLDKQWSVYVMFELSDVRT